MYSLPLVFNGFFYLNSQVVDGLLYISSLCCAATQRAGFVVENQTRHRAVREVSSKKDGMAGRGSDFSERLSLLERAFSRWDNEGRAGAGSREHPAATGAADVLPLSNAELVQLQIRVIALENLVTVLLMDSSERQLDLVREMAAYISPRSGFTQHRLTVHAAARMINLAESADHLRGLRLDRGSLDGSVDPKSQL